MPGFRTAAGSPLLLEDVLTRHPDLRVFVENAGYPFLDDMIAMMYQYPRLYGDLSTITWVIPRPAFHRYVEELVEAGLGHRLMFGSDQMRWPEKIGEAIEAIEEADYLTAEAGHPLQQRGPVPGVGGRIALTNCGSAGPAGGRPGGMRSSSPSSRRARARRMFRSRKERRGSCGRRFTCTMPVAGDGVPSF